MSRYRMTAKCGDCQMPLVWVGEYHPIEACEVWKATHDRKQVYAALDSKGRLAAARRRQWWLA